MIVHSAVIYITTTIFSLPFIKLTGALLVTGSYHSIEDYKFRTKVKVDMVHPEKSAEEDWSVEGVCYSPVGEGRSIYPQNESNECKEKEEEIKSIPYI